MSNLYKTCYACGKRALVTETRDWAKMTRYHLMVDESINQVLVCPDCVESCAHCGEPAVGNFYNWKEGEAYCSNCERLYEKITRQLREITVRDMQIETLSCSLEELSRVVKTLQAEWTARHKSLKAE